MVAYTKLKIPANREAEIKRILVLGQLLQKVLKTPSQWEKSCAWRHVPVILGMAGSIKWAYHGTG
jgi:hypothetical protein